MPSIYHSNMPEATMPIDKRIRLAWQNRNIAKQANFKTDVRP